ncbi:MAG: hypothetical protein O9267_09400 [Flavobacterium sp.]|uniref:hypothetical protein n=1 Tax=Flavobacterium sp. TaxID=239 RepID=UPI0022CA9300|nr:hypothetical protein [Flavobacterium sp.]MCZ8197810.1 hypothetical protein [Flavobacterium sp.]
MKALKTILTITIISLFATSCSKPEDGAVGPQGETGTANVIYNNWTLTNFNQNGTLWVTGITAPKITQDVIDKGLVLVYMKNTSVTPNQIIQLNFSQGSQFVTFNIEVGLVNVISNTNFSVFPFRYIIIPEGVSVSGKMAKSNKPDFKKMSYSEVCQQLHISE